jgi:hypothetical protein
MPRETAETDRFRRLPEPVDPDSLIATQDHSSSPDPDLEAERAFLDRGQG